MFSPDIYWFKSIELSTIDMTLLKHRMYYAAFKYFPAI